MEPREAAPSSDNFSFVEAERSVLKFWNESNLSFVNSLKKKILRQII